MEQREAAIRRQRELRDELDVVSGHIAQLGDAASALGIDVGRADLQREAAQRAVYSSECRLDTPDWDELRKAIGRTPADRNGGE